MPSRSAPSPVPFEVISLVDDGEDLEGYGIGWRRYRLTVAYAVKGRLGLFTDTGSMRDLGEGCWDCHSDRGR